MCKLWDFLGRGSRSLKAGSWWSLPRASFFVSPMNNFWKDSEALRIHKEKFFQVVFNAEGTTAKCRVFRNILSFVM